MPKITRRELVAAGAAALAASSIALAGEKPKMAPAMATCPLGHQTPKEKKFVVLLGDSQLQPDMSPPTEWVWICSTCHVLFAEKKN